jgi:glyoxylase-like metal-dependent hydrolase (beta-lactamase superfamily II)
LADGPLHGFTASQTITSAGDVSVVETTGHTPGHVSVIVTEDDGTQIFLAGDTSYTEATMRSQQVDGVSPKAAAARDTLKRIAAFCEAERVVYLPTHDPESVSRLEQRTPVGATTSLAAT